MTPRWQRAFTLGWWLFLRVLPGGLRWRYWRGAWLEEFRACTGHRPMPKTVKAFEADRRFLSERFLASKDRQPMPTTDTEAEELWRDDICFNHLYSFIGRRERHPLRFLRLMRHLPWSGRVLEYGAGAAPLAHGITKAWPFPAPEIDVADIDWPLRDYCERRFCSDFPTISVISVRQVQDHVDLLGLYSAIVCTETLEHVPDPTATARLLLSWLKPGGVLLYDYAPQGKNQPMAPRGMSARDETIKILGGTEPDVRGLRIARKA